MEGHRERVLASIRDDLLAMGDLVGHQVKTACQAVFEGDDEAARSVVAHDADVDAYDTRIQKECLEFLALGQPFAADLRLLVAMLSINAQLERIGDIAVNIAEQTEPLKPFQPFVRGGRLAEMVRIAQIMLEDSLGAFAHADAARARHVLDWDAVVDRLDRDQSADLVSEMKRDRQLVDPSVSMLAISKQLERMADHATNIAEEVVFIVDARIIKHTMQP